MIRNRILPIPMGVLPNSYGAALSLTMDEDYIIHGQLIDQNGYPMGEEQTIDTPLETTIISGRYDSNTESLILVLQNGDEITIPISDLISGLQEEITAQNPLSADLLTDGTNNKVFTAAEQTKLSGIAAGAEVNVQANWNESDSTSDSYIQNKPTLGTMAAESASDYTPTSSLSSVALSGSYTDLSNKPTLGTMAEENASDYTPTSSLSSVALSGSYTDLSNTPSLATVATTGDYTDLSNTPSLATVATSGSYTDLYNTPDLSDYSQLAEDNTFTGTNTFDEGASIVITNPENSTVNVELTNQNIILYDTNGDAQTEVNLDGLSSYVNEEDQETGNTSSDGAGLAPGEICIYRDEYDVDTNIATTNEVLLHKDEILLHTLENDGQGGDSETVYVTINQGGIEVNDGSITIDGNAVVTDDQLATVATTGDYDDLSNKPTIPTVNDATITLQDGNGTSLGSFTTNDANNQTITIPAGGGNEWFGTQAQFDALSSYDADTDYFISDKIDYNTDVVNKPNLNIYATKNELTTEVTTLTTKNNEQDVKIACKLEGSFLTEHEYSQLTPREGVNYFIEGTTVQMEVTFSDQTTATYNLVID